MQPQPELASGVVKIIQIVLMESHFKRATEVIYDDQEKIAIDIDVVPTVDASKKTIVTEVRFEMNSTRGDTKQIDTRITMAGIFSFEGLSDEASKEFSKINAAAIVFPFVREHLMTTALKAGINPIVLNPVNFVELAKRKDK